MELPRQGHIPLGTQAHRQGVQQEVHPHAGDCTRAHYGADQRLVGCRRPTPRGHRTHSEKWKEQVQSLQQARHCCSHPVQATSGRYSALQAPPQYHGHGIDQHPPTSGPPSPTPTDAHSPPTTLRFCLPCTYQAEESTVVAHCGH